MSKKEERITCLVPRNMAPSKQAFLDLGFTFKAILHSDLELVTLPEGWKSVANEDLKVNLIDEKGCKRGSYIYEPLDDIFAKLYTRFYYSIKYDPDDETKSSTYIFVKDRANQRILWSEKCDANNELEKTQLITEAKSFLKTHYPDWRDPSKYWD